MSLVVVIFSTFQQPHHKSLPMPFIAFEITNIKIALLVYLHSYSVSLVIHHLPLIYFSLGTRNDTFTVTLTIDYCSDIHSIIIEGYFRPAIV